MALVLSFISPVLVGKNLILISSLKTCSRLGIKNSRPACLTEDGIIHKYSVTYLVFTALCDSRPDRPSLPAWTLWSNQDNRRWISNA